MANYEDELFVLSHTHLPQELFDQIEAHVKPPDPPSGRMINIDNTYKPLSFLHINRYPRRKSATTYYSTNTFSFTDLQVCCLLKVAQSSETKRTRRADQDTSILPLSSSHCATPAPRRPLCGLLLKLEKLSQPKEIYTVGHARKARDMSRR
ncbi:hypothetical protein TI39_contig4206g00005 [Zymoseptoria brevis]|uniref:Uncharacterized protein n=1 Tax=Zymoseptoria brevis TaxID=1047168 RepID=A0A0F4GA30_9PEZI|nr:hypothetical protein TI39_contig4206g00005 [Zymoseptoria brevis]